MPSLPHSKKWWQNIWAIIVAVGVIIGIIAGILQILGAFKGAATSPSANATATAAQLAHVAATSSAAPTSLTTAAPLPTVVMNPHKDIPEIGGSPYRIDLVVDTITTYRSKQTMDWKFTITNASGSTPYLYFSNVYLEDESSNKYPASGPAIGDFWTLNPGTSIDKTLTFNFLPPQGSTYTLNITIDDSSFQPTPFPFP